MNGLAVGEHVRDDPAVRVRDAALAQQLVRGLGDHRIEAGPAAVQEDVPMLGDRASQRGRERPHASSQRVVVGVEPRPSRGSS